MWRVVSIDLVGEPIGVTPQHGRGDPDEFLEN